MQKYIFCKWSSFHSQTFVSFKTLLLVYSKLVGTPCRWQIKGTRYWKPGENVNEEGHICYSSQLHHQFWDCIHYLDLALAANLGFALEHYSKPWMRYRPMNSNCVCSTSRFPYFGFSTSDPPFILSAKYCISSILWRRTDTWISWWGAP